MRCRGMINISLVSIFDSVYSDEGICQLTSFTAIRFEGYLQARALPILLVLETFTRQYTFSCSSHGETRAFEHTFIRSSETRVVVLRATYELQPHSIWEFD